VKFVLQNERSFSYCLCIIVYCIVLYLYYSVSGCGKVTLGKVKSLCLIKLHAMKTYWVIGVKIYSFLTSTPDEISGNFTLRPVYPRRMNSLYPLNRRSGWTLWSDSRCQSLLSK